MKNNTFAVNLIELRKDKKLSQSELAIELGIAQNTLCQYETGKHEPDFDHLIIIARFFGVSTDFLLGVSNECSVNASKINELNFAAQLSRIEKECEALQTDIAKLLNSATQKAGG